MLKKFDLYAIPLHFTYRNSNKSGSLLGVISSIIIVIFISILSFSSSQELWLKQTPTLSQAQYYLNQKLSIFNFPIALSVTNQNMKSYKIADLQNYLYLQSSIQYYDSKGVPHFQQRNLVSCAQKATTLPSEAINIIRQTDYENFFCIDYEENDFVEGNFATINSYQLQIQIYYCAESGNENCKSIQETQQFLNDYIIFGNLPLNININGNNYADPLQISPYGFKYQGSFTLQKTNVFTIQLQQIKSDDGILLSSWNQQQGYSVIQQTTDFKEINAVGNNKYLLSTMYFAASNQANLTTRVYMKIGDALAKILGFLGACNGIWFIVLNTYQQFSLNVNFYKSLLEIGFQIHVNEKGQLNLIPLTNNIKSEQEIQTEKHGNLQEQTQNIFKMQHSTLNEFYFFRMIYLKILKIFSNKQNQELDNYIIVNKSIENFLSLEGLFTTILQIKLGQDFLYQISQESQVENEFQSRSKNELKQNVFEELTIKMNNQNKNEN